MKRLLLPLALALVLVGASACAGRTPDVTVNSAPDPTQFGLTVQGVGTVSGAPDTLHVTMGVSVKRSTVGDALHQASASANSVIDALKKAGVDDKSIQTRDYSIDQQFRSGSGSTQIPDGYRVTNTVDVTLHDLDHAGALIDLAVGAGGDDIRLQGVSFDLEKDTALLDEARAEAWKDARQKAERLARLSGLRLGPPEYISDGGAGVAPTYQDASAAYRAESAAPIEPGQVDGTVQITVRYPLRAG